MPNGEAAYEYPDKVCAIRKTAKGLYLKHVGSSTNFWIPRDGIHDNSEVFEVGQKGKLVVYAWCAGVKGWNRKHKELTESELKMRRTTPCHVHCVRAKRAVPVSVGRSCPACGRVRKE